MSKTLTLKKVVLCDLEDSALSQIVGDCSYGCASSNCETFAGCSGSCDGTCAVGNGCTSPQAGYCCS